MKFLEQADVAFEFPETVLSVEAFGGKATVGHQKEEIDFSGVSEVLDLTEEFTTRSLTLSVRPDAEFIDVKFRQD